MENTMKRGDKVICNGYRGSVYNVCDGQLKGMVEVRVPGGLTCVSASDLRPITENTKFDRLGRVEERKISG